ncbi:MAG: hypothetical protein JWN87_2433 [Frankiales bacterium]|jgi:predicted enzyme related to lactoylglutathione lyase|nr:hypothetical protein [Frankiales bacterium]
MTSGMRTVIYPVKDLGQAKQLYSTLLGVEPDMDAAYYVGYSLGDQHLGLDPNGHAQGMTGPLGYWHVDDVQATLDRLVGAGALERQPVRDVGGGRLIASVTDPDGNVIGLVQAPG